MQNKQLKLDFQGFWHVGSGRGDGYHLDAICLKDQFELPFVPGKQLKGLLRHAVRRAENWGWYADIPKQDLSFESLIFGSNSQDVGRYATFSGMIFVDNANLSQAEYQYLAHTKQAQLRQYIFQDFFSTAIDEMTGIAKDHSLRGMEVALPLVLFSELIIRPTALDMTIYQQQQAILSYVWQILEQALPLVDAIGAYRSRGLGEVIVSLEGK